MSIVRLIKRKSKQPAVYWGSPVNDGRGKYTFQVVEQVWVRWEDETENFAKDARSRIQIGKDGREFRPNSVVYTSHIPQGGWDLDGFMWRGLLTDLPQGAMPYNTKGAYEIKQINISTELDNVEAKLYQILL